MSVFRQPGKPYEEPTAKYPRLITEEGDGRLVEMAPGQFVVEQRVHTTDSLGTKMSHWESWEVLQPTDPELARAMGAYGVGDRANKVDVKVAIWLARTLAKRCG